ncbi:polysaccharide deacetylase family protein [Marinicrinis lubricantis]|uniref:Polysaccharide deacetylase family protein n=1 Tax=Marinicrinis lubricantis TaxID=2086470 RepID=A0ABW1IQ25_9BACL
MVYDTIIHHVKTSTKAVAFTFDDGPNPVYTPQVLEIFKEVNGKATFFMIGERMLKYPEIVDLVTAAKHEIGNHTNTHPGLSKLDPADVRHEIIETDRIIERMIGKRPVTFRPPYFDYSEEARDVCLQLGYRTIGAVHSDARDWEMPGVDHIVAENRKQIRPGSIFIFHDGFDDRSQTVEAVRILAHELVEQGYELVTVSELMNKVAE